MFASSRQQDLLILRISRTNVSGAYGALSVQQSLTGEDYVPIPLPPAWPLMGQAGF